MGIMNNSEEKHQHSNTETSSAFPKLSHSRSAPPLTRAKKIEPAGAKTAPTSKAYVIGTKRQQAHQTRFRWLSQSHLSHQAQISGNDFLVQPFHSAVLLQLFPTVNTDPLINVFRCVCLYLNLHFNGRR